MKSAVQSNCEKQFLLKGIQERKVRYSFEDRVKIWAWVFELDTSLCHFVQFHVRSSALLLSSVRPCCVLRMSVCCVFVE